jgi:hypothetical protein
MPSPNASAQGASHASPRAKQWIDLLLNAATPDGAPVGGDVVQALVRLARGQDQIITLLENLAMALPAEAQTIVDQINTNTNKLGAAQTAWNKTLQDTIDKLSSGQMSVAEFVAAAQPALDAQGQIADALIATASAADPVVTPTAPPIVVPETPVP